MNTTWNSEDWFWKRTIIYSAIAVAVIAAGGAYFYFMKSGSKPGEQPQAAAAPVAAPTAQAPEHHPIPEPGADDAAAAPLPPLSESDPALTDALSNLVGEKSVEQFLVPSQVVRHFVVTVDNLPRSRVAEQMRPVKPTSGQTVVVTNGDSITLSEDNYARYAPLMNLVQNMDTGTLGALYIRFYPLFQEEYENLGYPGQYFNDRLVQVIDHLLQTPELSGPVALKQGHVFYEYADPALEARSAGQKLLMRMGSRNEAIIKAKLRELRGIVTQSQSAAGSRSPPGSAER